MLLFAAWMLVALGFAHVVFGLVRFQAPLRDALADGLVGAFMHSDTRRLTFWFILVGPLLVLIGQVALRAIATGDLGLIKTIGWYLFGACALGVLAFPRSPMWLLLPPSAIFMAAGFGWIAAKAGTAA